MASADVSCGAARSAVMPERLEPASRMLLLPGRMLSYVALLLCMFCAALLMSFRVLTWLEALTFLLESQTYIPDMTQGSKVSLVS